ncbi:MAG: hypothetical protein IPN83_07565 [Holophagales bacterium]|nr:hypothetical protein [Holophagales bacterium]
MRPLLPRSTRAPGLLLAGLFAFCAFLPAAPSRAQDVLAPPHGPAGTVEHPVTLPPADVMVGNRRIATLRGILFQNPPQERARVANERIETAVAAGRDLAVTVRSEGNVRLFLIGGRGVFGLTVADLDQGSPATLEQVVTETVALLEQAIRETREQRSLPDLLKALATSAVATLLLVLLLVVLERLRRWGSRKATEKAHERLGAMRIPGKGLLEKDRLYFVTTRVLLLLTRAVDLLAIYVWFTFVLERFAWSRPWGEQLGSWLLGTTGRLGMSALGAIPDLVVVGLIYLATRWLLRFIGYVFTAIEEAGSRSPRLSGRRPSRRAGSSRSSSGSSRSSWPTPTSPGAGARRSRGSASWSA